jgi:hypothetical protein
VVRSLGPVADAIARSDWKSGSLELVKVFSTGSKMDYRPPDNEPLEPKVDAFTATSEVGKISHFVFRSIT